MGERQRLRPEEMATTSTAVATVPPQLQEDSAERTAVITLRQTVTSSQTQARKKVVWTEDTVDNENMNKKKSKCCCIYEKPYRFGESDSEDSDDECEHCFGHVERRKKHHQHDHQHQHEHQHQPITADVVDTATEPTATITLQPSEPAPAPPDKAPPSTSS